MMNLSKRCRDARGKPIHKGWYFHSEEGYVEFIEENVPKSLLEQRTWLVRSSYRNTSETAHFRFNRYSTSRCIPIDENMMKIQGNANAQWVMNIMKEETEKRHLKEVAHTI